MTEFLLGLIIGATLSFFFLTRAIQWYIDKEICKEYIEVQIGIKRITNIAEFKEHFHNCEIESDNTFQCLCVIPDIEMEIRKHGLGFRKGILHKRIYNIIPLDQYIKEDKNDEASKMP